MQGAFKNLKTSFMRGVMPLLLCCASTFSLAACGGGDGGPTPGAVTEAPPSQSGATATPGASQAAAGGDSVAVAISSDVGSLDPRKVSGSGFFPVISSFSETLWEFGYNNQESFVLAEGRDKKSSLEYTIRLKENIKFSNGGAFNADDVIFTFNLWKNDPSRTHYLQAVDMEKTKKIDDYTVDLRYTHYNVGQLAMLGAVYIVDAETYDEDNFSQNPVGTGPYLVQEYVTNSYVTMKARDDYWGGELPVKNIEFKVINEDAQKVNALDARTVDLVGGVPTGDVEYVKSLPDYETRTVDLGYALSFSFNLNEASVFYDKNARYAVAYAVDKQAIINAAFDGYATESKLPFAASLNDYSDSLLNLHDTYTRGYDIELAREYAEKAGLVGKEVEIVTYGDTGSVLMAQILQESLGQIGVALKISNYDMATYYTVTGDPTRWDLSTSVGAGPCGLGADVMTTFVSFTAPSEVRDKIVAAGTEIMGTDDSEEYAKKMVEFVRLFEEECPWYSVLDVQSTITYSKKIVGFDLYGGTGYRIKDWTITP
ncbi:MAG: ABC transporter substrate-binding protein [Oscillospiraceae bacterium]|nr:ABC transporter substrate-binding protein [Oscillospiraceae bacterium]